MCFFFWKVANSVFPFFLQHNTKNHADMISLMSIKHVLCAKIVSLFPTVTLCTKLHCSLMEQLEAIKVHKGNDYIEVASEMFYVASKVKQTCL